MIRVAAYARYSSDNHREVNIEVQLRAIWEYFKKNDIQLVKICTDKAKSATTANRPARFLKISMTIQNLSFFNLFSKGRLNITAVILHVK